VEEKVVRSDGSRKLFGTFSGVFTPTLLTILGVIMYLREGWVVGNAGLLGAWLIILLAFSITTFTALSLSSIVTNIRIGAGGAFSIISQSLGLEVGGSIGIPLYISQALAVAMYIFGFRAGWLWIFPEHPPLVVDLLTFLVLFGIAFVSAGLAFKVQYVILVVIIGSLAAVAATVFTGDLNQSIQWWGDFQGAPETGFTGIGFWAVFAVFFPASTGIMAGANMSGDLKDPRKSIPKGTLAAIGLSLLVYLFLAWWLAVSASTDELLSNYTIMIDRSAWGPAVLAGLLGATFSSALSSLVGAPRILQALGKHYILPGSSWISVRTRGGEPRNAMLITGALVLAALMLRNLNAIAPLITMFFLITYGMINIVVFIEQTLGLVSFRPLLRIPRIVSLLGAVGCVFVMFIVNPVFGGVAVVVVLVLHAYLIRRHLKAPFGDVRSGLFVALAEWAAKKIESLAGPRAKTWKANLLVPVQNPAKAEELYPLLRDFAAPKGFVRMLGLTGKRNAAELTQGLDHFSSRFHDDGIFSNWTVIDAATFSDNLAAGIEALGGAFFRSSVIVMRFPRDQKAREEIHRIIRSAQQSGLGLVLVHGSSEQMDREGLLHLVLRKPKKGWKIGLDLDASNLAMLTAYKLKQNRKVDLVLTGVLHHADEQKEALDYLRAVTELGRIPNVRFHVRTEDTIFDLEYSSGISVTLFSITPDTDFNTMESLAGQARTLCIFVMDSGKENALI
ncbi:MAG: amino acid permease, partial [bacterium]